MSKIISMTTAGIINQAAGLSASDFTGFLKNKAVSDDDVLLHGGNSVTIKQLRQLHNISDSDLISYAAIPKKVKEMMASLDAMYAVFVEHNSNPADTIAYYNNTYGFSTASVKDMLTVAIIKANKDIKGESCLADVEALIARHKQYADRVVTMRDPGYTVSIEKGANDE